MLIVLLGTVSEVSFTLPFAQPEAKPRNAKEGKKQARLDRKQGEGKDRIRRYAPAIPEIANALPIRPDGKFAHEVDQIKPPPSGWTGMSGVP